MEFTARAIEDSDLECIMNWRMSPEVTTYMKTNPKLTLEDQRKWFETISKNEAVKYWLIEVDGKRAGDLNLADIDRENKTASGGYYIGETKLRSLELAMSLNLSLYDYAFEEMGLEGIHSEVFSINAGVVKLNLICGCSIERVVEGEVEKEGTRYDVTHMIMTKKEWQANKGKYRYKKITLD